MEKYFLISETTPNIEILAETKNKEHLQFSSGNGAEGCEVLVWECSAQRLSTESSRAKAGVEGPFKDYLPPKECQSICHVQEETSHNYQYLENYFPHKYGEYYS